MTNTLQSAYILHTYHYKETSRLVHFFTPDYGKIVAVARGVRARQSRFKNYLRPFTRLLISWSGKSELVNLTFAENEGTDYEFSGAALFSGIYLNELLLRLLQPYDSYPALFHLYHQTLLELQKSDKPQEKVLRLFEKQLLNLLGYGLQFDREASGENIQSGHWYRLDVEQGLIKQHHHAHCSSTLFCGHDLLAFAKDQLDDKGVLLTAKRLMRQVLNSLLGNKIIKSRELFG